MTPDDPYNLQRFISAQGKNYHSALRELEAGRKRSHWIWYIFPQVAGLGHSSLARFYSIRSKGEARAYRDHPQLGRHLHCCCETLVQHEGEDIHEIMGYPDDLKLFSSMTLFALVSDTDSIFHRVLATFYQGRMDERTVAFLAAGN